MKVLFVASGNSQFGVSPLIQSQALSLIKAGIDVDIYGIKGNGFTGYARNIFKLREFLKSRSFDILHAHYGSSAIVTFWAKGNQPVVVSFMGDDILGAKNDMGQIKLVSFTERLLNILMARLFYNHIVLKSEEMYSFFKKSKKVSIIPNGVNLRLFYPNNKSKAREKLMLKKDKKIVIFVSDPCRPEKNYSLALKAKDKCKYQIQLCTVVGIPHEKLKDYYNAADLLILTSFHEGSPNVVKEAMACNCPIVSTDVGDVKWLFNNEPGYFIVKQDENEIAKGIDRAIEFSENQDRTNGRQRIIQLGLDSESIANQIIKIYNNLLMN